MTRELTTCPLCGRNAEGHDAYYRNLRQYNGLCALTEADIPEWVARHNFGEDGPDTYEWDEGIAP